MTLIEETTGEANGTVFRVFPHLNEADDWRARACCGRVEVLRTWEKRGDDYTDKREFQVRINIGYRRFSSRVMRSLCV